MSFRGTQRRFLPRNIENTFKAILIPCRYLEMYSKQGYKICVCPVILGELEPIGN